jgi:hypothetical protein
MQVPDLLEEYKVKVLSKTNLEFVVKLPESVKIT